MTAAGPAPAPLLRLLPHHLEDLRRSGLSEKTIATWGVYSVERDQKSVLVQLGFGHVEPPALALPILPPDRTAPNRNEVILKPDNPRRDARGRAIKYECRPGSRNRIHAPLAVRDKLGDTSVTLFLTEGAKKAEKAAQEGLCCIAVAGVWNWLDRIGPASFPIGDFDSISLGGRRVVEAFDSDASGNSHVRRAERALAGFLTERGARASVKRLPPAPDGEKMGLDDFLVLYGLEAFHKLLEQPVESESDIASGLLQWPEPPAPEAFYGLAGEIVRAIEPQSEADPAALLVQILVAFGNVVDRGPRFRVEADVHCTNLFAIIVGVTSKARKGVSWSHVREIFACVDPAWGRDRIQSGVGSGEGLISAVQDPIVKSKTRTLGREEEILDEGVSDKRLMIFESEFASPLRIIERPGNTLSPIIRQAWDSGCLQSLVKNSPLRATGALISLVGHVTRSELTRYLSLTEIGNGFGNRFLWICARRSKLLPEGGRFNEGYFEPLLGRLRGAVEYARKVGEMRRDDQARATWCDVYAELTEGHPGLLGALLSRAEAQVLRLSMVYALLDCSPVIRNEHLLAALALWEYAEASAKFIFGDSLGDPLADELLRTLRSNPAGLTRTEIRDLLGRHKGATDIDRALTLLVEHGLASRQAKPTRGRPVEHWEAVSVGAT